MASNGPQAHHSQHDRWPVVLVGNAGRKLNADAVDVLPARRPRRRGDLREKDGRRPPVARSLADLYVTLSHALGIPKDDFGEKGVEAVKGPLPELLV